MSTPEDTSVIHTSDQYVEVSPIEKINDTTWQITLAEDPITVYQTVDEDRPSFDSH